MVEGGGGPRGVQEGYILDWGENGGHRIMGRKVGATVWHLIRRIPVKLQERLGLNRGLTALTMRILL